MGNDPTQQLKREISNRKGPDKYLKERLKFEALLFDLSARFININPDQVDLEVESALRKILGFFAVGRCGLIRVPLQDAFFRITQIDGDVRYIFTN